MENPRLIIELMPDGTVNVSGPIGNKILCWGMLGGARNAIDKFNPGEQSLITPARMVGVRGNGFDGG